MRALAACVLVACGSGAQPQKPVQGIVAPPKVDAPAQPPDPEAPALRLPKAVRPLRHDVHLVLDPATEEFSGTITIELEVAEATSVIWLHGEEITLKRVALASGSQMFSARPIYPSKEQIGLVLSTQLPRGRAKLTMEYTGKIHRNDGTGIYTAQEAGDWYLYTQFEATDAREAFPCFDEPSFKAPWKLSIQTKKDLAAFSNTPITGEKDLGNGSKLVEFAETKPLPSYLVAFAVGPFETIDAGKTRNGAPIRIVVPKGRTGDVAYPVATTGTLVALLEDYFGTPYPYEKLDMLACAVFNAGAMENPGLVTWRQQLLLTKPADDTLDRQQTYAVVAAHEIAHMWFGDFVTLAWWDDTWLNEAFATWMEDKVITQWKPAWDGAIEAAGSKNRVMGSDSLDAARAVHQPIASSSDIQNAFDGITYQKGKSVIAMVESYVGPEVFKTGVRAYLAKHAWGNATYDDFVDAIVKADLDASKGDRYQRARAILTKPIFDSFIKQSGVPLVEFELQCKGGSPSLAFTQRRYAPTGSAIDPKRTWTIPVCVRWGVGTTTGRDCTTVREETWTLQLSARSCPDWLHPNENSIGYYRMLPKGKLLDNLLAKAPKVLTLPERVGLLGDVNALVASGAASNGVALALVESLSKDKNRHIVDASIGVVAGIEDMVPDNLQPNYQRLIKKLYGARATQLGFRSKSGEDDNTKKLRPTLLALVAIEGRDEKLIATATELAWKWLADRKAVEPELVGTVLGIAAKFGDQKLFDRFHADAKAATNDRADRGRLLGAMGSFTDPKIVAQAMAISLTDEFELREGLSLLQGGFGDRRTRLLAYEFVKKNFDAILKKLPEPFRPYMAFTFVSLCDDSKKAEVEAFFKPRMEKIEGGARTMAQALESFSLCAAAKKAQTPGVVTFLKRQ